MEEENNWRIFPESIEVGAQVDREKLADEVADSLKVDFAQFELEAGGSSLVFTDIAHLPNGPSEPLNSSSQYGSYLKAREEFYMRIFDSLVFAEFDSNFDGEVMRLFREQKVLLDRLGIDDVTSLSPKQAIELANATATEFLRYRKDSSAFNEAEIDGAGVDDLLLLYGEGVCRNYVQAVFAVFRSLQRIQRGPSQLDGVFLGNGSTARAKIDGAPLDEIVGRHAWVSFHVYINERVYVITLDPTWQDELVDAKNDAYSRLFGRVGEEVRKEMVAEFKRMDDVGEYQSDYDDYGNSIVDVPLLKDYTDERILFELYEMYDSNLLKKVGLIEAISKLIRRWEGDDKKSFLVRAGKNLITFVSGDGRSS